MKTETARVLTESRWGKVTAPAATSDVILTYLPSGDNSGALLPREGELVVTEASDDPPVQRV